MGSTETILIVEDDALTREALAQLLEDEGYDVATAGNGLEGKEYLSTQEAPDLIISDVAMPGLDGFDLVKWLRADASLEDTPVILWSARSNTDDKVNGLDVGADDYLCKPVDPDELLAKVRSHLRRASRSRELLLAAIVDPLTGVRNRRGIIEVLDAEIARTERTGQQLCVFMVDLDNFKQINDTQGHAAGDAALRRVATQLKRVIRPYDTVGRFGGDEFVIVASGLSSKNMRAMEMRLRESTPGVALSVGAATAVRDESREELIRRADDAMYREKRQRSDESSLRH